MKFDRSDAMAFMALLVSLAALGVSIFEAKIMRDQQEIMQTQQKASVFPYVTESLKFSLIGEPTYFEYAIQNKGVGPAKIKTSSFFLNDQKMEGYLDLQKAFRELLPKEANHRISFTDPENYFISSKERIRVLRLEFDASETSTAIISDIQFRAEFCYCSIYDDCWTTSEEPQSDIECN